MRFAVTSSSRACVNVIIQPSLFNPLPLQQTRCYAGRGCHWYDQSAAAAHGMTQSTRDGNAATSRPKLKTALVMRGHTQPLKDGTVKPRTFEFDFEDLPTIISAFRRMVRGLEFDIAEMAMTTYLCARAHGVPFTAIPVFPMRAFHHGAIVYNTSTGVRTPKDLEGRKVGVNRGYTVTTGLWARSILQHECGVDLSRVTWVLSGDEHVAAYRPRRTWSPSSRARHWRSC
jgi:4,5-dihydroxyphthalate decarboxylase